MWLYILATIFLAVWVPILTNLWKNYQIARRIGPPLVISLLSQFFPPVSLTGRAIRSRTKHWPWPFSTLGQYCYYGWAFDDRRRTHERLGPIFVNVTPYRNTVVIADAAAIGAALTRYREFRKLPGLKNMDLFGRNINSVEDDDWTRHRRLTAPAFNEKCSSLVWEESLKQARGMLKSYSAAGAAGSISLANDAYTVALHVLSRVAFGIDSEFGEGVSKARPGYKLPFRDAIQTVLTRAILVVVVGRQRLLSSFMPASFQRLGVAVNEYERYVSSMLGSERKASAGQNGSRNNLVSVLATASDSEKASGRLSQSMSDEEIMGNIWIFFVAGHDTTANTISFAIAMLAGHPKVQDWLSEEINAVMGDEEHPNYEETYPKLVRCLALMYETLRLFSAVPENPKWISDSKAPVTIQVGSKNYTIPPDTFVQLNLTALFSSPEYFSPDPLVWRPDRFVVSSALESDKVNGDQSTSSTPKMHAKETIWEPPRGSFIPFSDGPRNCVGQKFARVEFVAVMATFFRRHRVKPLCKKGETLDHARARAVKMAMDAQTGGVALKMSNPESVALVWERV